jgi:hypothetical protein
MRLCYVRFGHIPETGYSKNHLTGECENGTSVYEALERGGKYQIILPKIESIGSLGMCFNVSQCISLLKEKPLFEVEGDHIGVGSDGEPLLKNCRVVKEILDNI